MVRARILEPYTRRVDDTRHRIGRVAVIGMLVLLAMMLGFVIAILPIRFVLIPLAPIILLAVLALWLAPDSDRRLDGTVRKLLLLFTATAMVWPDYIALTAPGVGWVSPQRFFMGLLLIVTVYALATSAGARAHVLDVMSHVKPIYWAFLGFFVLQLLLAFVTFRFSGRVVFSQIFWYFMFVAAVWTYSNPNTVRRLYQIVLIGFAVQCIYGALHWWLQRPVWTGYIPDFLLVEPELLASILGDNARSGDGQIRVTSLYFTALTFAEAIAILLPFVVFGIIYGRNAWIRMSAAALFVFAFYNAIWTDARTAMIGFIVAPLAMIGLWGVQRYRRKHAERDIVAPAVIWAYPAGLILVMGSVLFVHRIRLAVLGGGRHQASNDAREVQWERTFDLLQTNPFGFGPFTAADRVGYTNRGGEITIDGYMMNLLLDFGVLGWLLYLFLFLGCATIAVKTFLRSETHEEDIAGPLAVSVLNFMIVKMVLSQTENHYLMFGFIGCIVALHWRQEQRRQADASARLADAVAVAARGGSARASPVPGRAIPAPGYGVAPAR